MKKIKRKLASLSLAAFISVSSPSCLIDPNIETAVEDCCGCLTEYSCTSVSENQCLNLLYDLYPSSRIKINHQCLDDYCDFSCSPFLNYFK